MVTQQHYKARVRTKGQITLPRPIRDLLGIEEGDDLAFYIDESGRVVIDRLQVVPPEQAWFWTRRWQDAEREVEHDLLTGGYKDFETIDDLVKDLESEA